jgi:site-specific recombinase XerD
MTKEEIWEKLATEVKLRGFSPQTYHTYKCNINGFLDWAGKPYEELDEDDFRNYLIFLINEGRIEKGTINNRNGSIRFFLVVILGKNINYMRTARLRGVTSLPTVWSKETVERFFSVIENPRDLAIFVNIYGSGLRISEICKLKIEDIDSKNMRIFIRQAKCNKDRYTILSQRGLDALRRYWKIFKPSSPEHYLFPNRWDKERHLMPCRIEIIFNKYKAEAGITESGTVHTLRHCFATHALEAGTDVLYIKQLMGHSCFSSTDRYLHVAKTSVYQTKSPADDINL